MQRWIWLLLIAAGGVGAALAFLLPAPGREVAVAPDVTGVADGSGQIAEADDGAPGFIPDSELIPVRVLVKGAPQGSGEEVRIACTPDHDYLPHAGRHRWSAEKPVIHIRPGRNWLQAFSGESDERKSEPVEVHLPAESTETLVTLELVAGPGLEGRLLLDPGLAEQRFRVRSLAFEGDRAPDVLGRRVGRAGVLDLESMRYSFPGIESRQYLVWVSVTGAEVLGSAVVHVEDRICTRDIEVAMPDPAKYLAVRVSGPDDKSVDSRKTSIWRNRRFGDTVHQIPAPAIALANGTWLVDPAPRTEEESDRILWIGHAEYGYRVLAVEAGAGGSLSCRFEQPVELSVSLPGFASEPLLRDASLRLLTPLELDASLFSTRRPRREGHRFTFTRVQPGPRILLLVTRDTDGPVIIDRRPIAVSKETGQIEWPLPTLHTVRVHVSDPEQGARFRLVRLDPHGEFVQQTGVAGLLREAVLRFVPPGRYELRGTYAGREIRIPFSVPDRLYIEVE